jgi:ferredoxin
MEVRLDADKCQGHLRCMDIAPDIFDCDDLGYGRVVHCGPVPEQARRAIAQCVSNCPEKAISLH